MPSLSPAAVRLALRIAIVGAVIVASFAVRVVTSAAAELAQGERSAARSDWNGAIAHYRRAARWYAPGSPYHVRALAALATIGAESERRGDLELALSAQRAVRAAILSTRSFYTPEPTRLAAANERIAAMMATLPAPPMDAGKSKDTLRREHLALLEADNAPSVAWTLVLLAGFVAWVGGAFAFTLRAIDEHDRWIALEAKRWGTVIVVGLVAFVVGLLRA